MTAITAFVPSGYSSSPYAVKFCVRTTGDCGVCRWYALVSERCPTAWKGTPMVCLPIWHWYMLRGDWLKSQKGVSDAMSESMLCGVTSACDASARPSSSAPYDTRKVVCSSGPMSSVRPRETLSTGRSGRAGPAAR